MFGIFVKTNHVGKLYYTLTDHLGSLTEVLDASTNQPVQSLSFSAWGIAREAENWNNEFTGELFADRGFTGHEHLPAVFGLIDMNGRMYDPVLGRFLSPDPYVQASGYAQNFNRYAYCLNNPLTYVDPDGESFIVIGLIVLGSMLIDYGVQVAINHSNGVDNIWVDNIDWVDIAVSGVVGGLTAGYGSTMSTGAKLALTYGAPLVSAGIDMEYNREEGGMELDHKFKKGEFDNFLYEYISSAIISQGVSAAGVKANTGINANDALGEILKKSSKEAVISFGGAFLYDRAASPIFESTQGGDPVPNGTPSPNNPSEPNVDPFPSTLPFPDMRNSTNDGIDPSLFNLR